MQISCGTTFWAPNRKNDEMHLTFVITTPQGKEGKVLIVNATDSKKNPDKSCVLLPSDHPGITKESTAFFIKASIAKASDIETALNMGLFKAHNQANASLIHRIQQSALVSNAFSDDNRKFLEDYINSLPRNKKSAE